MAYQQLQYCLRETRTVEDTLLLASQIWLAGIGALVRAQQEGRDFFDQLVQCGAVVEAVEDDHGLRELKQLARRVLTRSGQGQQETPTPEEIRSIAEAIQNFDLHLADLDLR
ncbi:MAG: phasin family protein [Candidatus Competibacteraceae bacterium]|nr:phasin family protein [Candidatus Competibacteraceae bacterium]